MMNAMNQATRVTIAALAALSAIDVAGAQPPSMVGVVRDSAGAPIPSAEVAVLDRRTATDSLGRFYLAVASADSLIVNVRRIGFESVRFTLSARDAEHRSIDVVLRRLATALPAVNVEETELRSRTHLKGFDERRERGLGRYVTRQEIEARNARLLSDVLRQARGIVVTRDRQGAAVAKFSTYQARACLPLIWLDGQRAPGLNIDGVSATDVEGVELYQSISTTPADFHRGNVGAECGTIVVWTKRPLLEGKK
jgi:hypothetical protein